jgi:hypothetical protein
MTDARDGNTPVVPTPAALRRPSGPVTVDPATFGSIDAQGNAYVNTPEGPVLVGQWAAGTPEAGLAFFSRKYEDLETERALVAQRLADGHISPEQAREALHRISEALNPPQCIGDLAGLHARIAQVQALVEDLAEVRAAERNARKEQARARRIELVDQAEGLQDSTSWKATSEAFTGIVEEWKTLPRADRASEQELWRRLSAARAAFDKRRRAHFAERETIRKQALTAKRAIITKAEQLAASTDWAGTSRAYKDLMREWKDAPRGSKSDEDKLWKKFRAAQDTFFAARTAADAAKDAELEPNIEPKTQLVVEAESLLPISDIPQAKKRMRDIQRRWDAIGDVPAQQRKALEGRLARVEEAFRKAEQQTWNSKNPEVRARAESTVSAFDGALAKLKRDHDIALEKGESAKAEDLQSRITQTEALKAAAEKAAHEFR